MREKSRWIRWLLVVPALLLLGLAALMVRGQGGNRYAPLEVETEGVREPGDWESGGSGVADIGGGGQTGGGTDVGGNGQADGGTETRPVIRLESETKAPEPEAEDDPLLLFAGDVLLSDHVLGVYDRAGGIQGVLDAAILEEIDSSDIFMVNQEFPFSERGTAAADKQFTFRLPLSRVPLMNQMGIDIVTLANNHALDFGTDALLDTCDALDQAGIRRVGAGANLEEASRLEVMEVGGTRFGFLGVSRVIPVGSWTAGTSSPGMFTTYDPNLPQVLETIQAAKTQCDYLVVYVHWGIERETEPEEYQRTMGKQYIDAGADMVVGSHPHVLQGIEYYEGRPIIYSLGNFVFGSSIPKTMLLSAQIGEEGTALRLIPCTSSAGYTVKLADEAAIQAFYREMEGMSFGISVDENGYVIP